MQKVSVNIERCKGCGYCAANCPQGAVSLSKSGNSKGYCYAVVDQEKCVSCGSCYKVCPDCVFEIL